MKEHEAMAKKHKKKLKRAGKGLLSLLLIASMVLGLPLFGELPESIRAMFPLADQAVQELADSFVPTAYAADEEWGECFYCGTKQPQDDLCDICEGCTHRSSLGEWDCFIEHHCQTCNKCVMLADPTVYCEECHQCWRDFDWYEHCLRCGAHTTDLCQGCMEHLAFACYDCHGDEMLCDYCGYCIAWPDYQCDGANPEGAQHCSLHCLICDVCHNCFAENDNEYCEYCLMCYDCAYNLARHCQSCGECLETTGRCAVGYCPDCCESLFHCELCGEHVGGGSAGWCSGSYVGGHCIECYAENCCEQCGVCFICEVMEECPDCGLCPECCLENSEATGCACATCIEDSSFDEPDHICDQCGAFSCVVGDFCIDCGLCLDCCEENSETRGCDCGTCVEDSWFLDPLHICDECGAFSCVVDEFCPDCMLCSDCCRENTLRAGCEHGICVESWLWKEHYCQIDRCCYDSCGHVPKNHTHTYTHDGFYCDICHAAKDGSPYIYFQPRDARCHTSTQEEEEKDANTVVFRVYAAGNDNVYQWYCTRNNGKPFKVTNSWSVGADTDTLTVTVPSESCHVPYEFYCVVANSKGSVTSSRAKLLSQHLVQWNDENVNQEADKYFHYLRCVGEGCDHIMEKEQHRLGISAVVTAATQYTKGKIVRKCHICGYQKFEDTPALGVHVVHEFKTFSNTRLHWTQCTCAQYGMPKTPHIYKKTLKRAATELSNGAWEYTCYECLYSYTTVIPKLEHRHVYWDGTQAMLDAYGIKSGEVSAVCYNASLGSPFYHDRFWIAKIGGKRCAHEEGAKAQHQYGEWVDAVAPTAVENGVMHRYCLDCNFKQSATLEKNTVTLVGYDYTDTSVHSARQGETVTLSYDFGKVGERLKSFTLEYVNSRTGSVLGSKTVNVTPGDSEYKVKVDLQSLFGIKTFDPQCGIVVKAQTVYCNHGYGAEQLPPVESTCSVLGYQIAVRCPACGAEEIRPPYVDYAPHTIELRNAKEATCYEAGYTGDEFCTSCSRVITKGEETPKLTHTPVLTGNVVPTCGDSGYSGDYKCKYCGTAMFAGSVLPATGNHKMTVVKKTDPTDSSPGVKKTYYHCTVCEYNYRSPEGKGRIVNLSDFLIPQTGVLLGDVDNDGKRTAGDARLALRQAVGLETYAEISREFVACDVDKDKKVTAGDARLILRAAVGLDDPGKW